MLKTSNTLEKSRQMTTKVCPQCGEQMKQKTEMVFIQECDRCLSKKQE